MRAMWGWVFGIAMVGCKDLKGLPDLVNQKPKVTFDQLRIKDINFERVDSVFVLKVKNPYPVGLSLTSQEWSLGLAGNDFLDGSGGGGVKLKANGTAPVRIPVGTKFQDIFSVVGAMKGQDEIPYTLKTKLGFNTPVGEIKVPLNHQGTFPALHLPKIRLKALRLDRIDLASQTAKLALDLGVNSDQGSAIGFDAVNYGIKLDGANVANGRTAKANIGDSSTLTIPINVKLLELGSGIVQAIRNKGTLDVGFDAGIDVSTPFGVVPLDVVRSKSLKLQ